MTQARFWIYANGGAVRVKINAGQTLHHSQGGPTDEGWHRESLRYSFDGETLNAEHVSDGADCDGRMTHYNESCCHANELAAGIIDDELGVTYPAWRQRKSSQRDYSAEAMGY